LKEGVGARRQMHFRKLKKQNLEKILLQEYTLHTKMPRILNRKTIQNIKFI